MRTAARERTFAIPSPDANRHVRILHTADWHLGKILCGVSLLDDQAHVLSQLVDLARAEKPDAIIIAGDLYDRAVPPPDSVMLLDEILTRLLIEVGAPIIAISGNHDSPERLTFGSRLLERAGLRIVTQLGGLASPIILRDSHGPVAFHAIPYTDPPHAREVLADDSLTSHDAAMRAILERARGAIDFANMRNVAIAHAFVAGGSECDSERPLTAGGAGQIGVDAFEGFDYVALGHLHAPQSFAKGRVRYSGSLLRFSVSEANQRKGVLLVEIDADGAVDAREIELTPRRNLRRIEGTFAEVQRIRAGDSAPEDYVSVELADAGLVIDAMAKLRALYPNILEVTHKPSAEEGEVMLRAGELISATDRELFMRFFHEVTAEELGDARAAVADRLIDELERADRASS